MNIFRQPLWVKVDDNEPKHIGNLVSCNGQFQIAFAGGNDLGLVFTGYIVLSIDV